MKSLTAWLSILHHIPNSPAGSLPLFFTLESLLIAPILGLFAATLVGLMLAGLAATGIVVFLPRESLADVLAVAALFATMTVVLLQVECWLMARRATDAAYDWCFLVHRELCLPAPNRNMNKKRLGAYIDKAYAWQASGRAPSDWFTPSARSPLTHLVS